MPLLSTWTAGKCKYEYECKYAACPFCYRGICIGSKEIAIKYNFCYKHKYETL